MIESFFVDDPPIVGAVFRIGAIEIEQAILQAAQQIVTDVCMYQQVIGGDAGLACIGEFADYDPSGGDDRIGILRYDDRALSPSSSVTGTSCSAASW